MAKNNMTKVRMKERHSHIYITLNVSTGNDWHLIKAVDWTEEGFNFFIQHEFNEKEVFFRKGINKFKGNIIWTRKNAHYSDILEMILNTMLFEELEKMDDKKEIFNRIVNLIRSSERIEEKKKLLLSLNRRITDDETEMLAKNHHEENALYRYGVKVESKEWTGITEYAFEASLAAYELDKINRNLSELAGEMK
jgi:predicted metal-binding transcription factor (methanogenesis marker protein 9)